MKKLLLLSLFLIYYTGIYAQPVFVENFNYASGALLTANGWTVSSGGGTNALTVTASGLSMANYPAVAGNAMKLTTSGEDDYKAFTPITSGDVYLSFLVNVTSAQAAGDYFIALSTSTSQTNYYLRTFIKSSGGGYLLGLSKNTDATTYGSTVLSFGTTYVVVCKHTFNTGSTTDDVERVFVFPAGSLPSTEPGTSEIGPYTASSKTDPTNLGIVTLRQGTAAQAPVLTIDGIQVATSWSTIFLSPTATAATNVLSTGFDANWNALPGASGYYLDVSTDNTFTNPTAFVTGFNSKDVGNVTAYTLSSLSVATTYFYRVRAYNSSGGTGVSSNVIGITTVQITLSATEGTAINYTEGDPATIVTSTTLIAATVANLDGAVVQITGNYANPEDLLSFTNQNGITGSWNAATGKLTLSGSATVANYQTALQSITYQNTSQNPSTLQRTVSFTASIGITNSNTATRNITVIAVNNPPVLAAIEGTTLNYNQGYPAAQITAAIVPSDVDNTTLASASVQITTNYVNGQDLLTIANQNGITGSWTAATGTLSLSGVASIANYQAALRSVKFSNTTVNTSSSTRTVVFTVNDGALNSNTMTRNISVNNPPILASIETSPLSYSPLGPQIQITNTITVADIDNATLAGATVQILGFYEYGKDVLTYVNANGISGSWDISRGILTLTGTASLANYQTALRSITYNNTSSTPARLTRTISIIVSDLLSNSNPATRDISLGLSAPTLSSIETSTINYKQGDPATPLTNSISVTDPNVATLESATIQITGNYQKGEDLLSFANMAGLTSVWNADQGTLLLHWSSTTANYQAALRSVTYSNLSATPTVAQRTITFFVNDLSSQSNTVTRTLNVIPKRTVVITSLPATIGKTTGAGTYFNGDSVKVTALPDSGYTFTGWTESGTTVSTSLSYIFTISANRILVANYSQIQYTVAVVSNPANAGSVSGGGTFTFGTSVILKAKPNDTYSFVNWTLADSVVSTSASFSLKVKRNWNLTANFVKTPVLTVTPDFVDAGSSAGTAVITITNTGGGTINWSVTADVFWVTIKSGTSGVNNGTINLSYMPNNSIARIGTITITAPGIAGSPKIIEVRQSSSATSVEDLNLGIPATYILNQNYPNPFNPSTKIRFGLPKESDVRLSIFNILGQEVARPVQSVLSAGYHEVNFNANNFPSGIYIYRISAGSFNEIKKMLLIK